MTDLYELAAASAHEFLKAKPGAQRHAMRELFDRLVDDEIVAAERVTADPLVMGLLAAIDYGTKEQR